MNGALRLHLHGRSDIFFKLISGLWQRRELGRCVCVCVCQI